jgi:hypothetical protein
MFSRWRSTGTAELVDVEAIAVNVSRYSPIQLTVNFGILAKRETSPSEIDKLGEMLLEVVSGVTLFAGHRYEFSQGAAESTAYEVKVDFPPFILPTEKAELDPLVDRLLETVALWAHESAARPPAEGEDLATRIARGPATEDF